MRKIVHRHQLLCVSATSGRGRRGNGVTHPRGSHLSHAFPPHLCCRYVELLKAKSLCIGMRVWGILLEVAPRLLTVSLPHGLRGHVVPEEVRGGQGWGGGQGDGPKEGKGEEGYSQGGGELDEGSTSEAPLDHPSVPPVLYVQPFIYVTPTAEPA